MNLPPSTSRPWLISRLALLGFLVAHGTAGRAANPVGRQHKNLVPNGSFEQPMAGVPTMAEHWSVRFADRGDDVERVSHSESAHRGRACVHLSSLSGEGITLDAQPESGVQLQPGKSYEVTLWARRADATNTVMIVEPGGGRFELSDEWKFYQLSYAHPADADPQLGFLVRIRNGAALIDDVALVPSGCEVNWAPELNADRDKLHNEPVNLAWRDNPDDPRWTQRTAVKTTELMGEKADDVTVRLKLCDLLPGRRYADVSPSVFLVVDGQTGETIPFALLNDDSFAGPSALDELAMRVSCPANSSKTYFVYFAPREFDEQESWPTELPLELARPSPYRNRLEVDLGSVELPLNVRVSAVDHAYRMDVDAIAPGAVTAKLVAPTGTLRQQWQWREADVPFRKIAKFSLDENAEEGVWNAEVELRGDETGQSWVANSCFVHGNAMWWANNADTLDPRRRGPRFGRQWIQLAAARNERESFQLAIASSGGLGGVVLAATDLAHSQTDGVIAARQVTFQYVEQVNIAIPHPRGVAAGWYGDPLVPWRSRNVPAGHTVTAWGTVDVDRSVEPGEYWGHVIATAADGTSLELPMRIEIFGFTLPEDLTMKAVLGGDIWSKVTKGYHRRSENTDPYRDIHDGGTAFALARLLAEYHATPFYYHHDKSPYAVPWHYDPENGTAEFDFRQLDRNAAVMLDEWGQDFLFFGGKFAAGWQRPGTVYDWHRDLVKARTALWEEAHPEHRFTRDTAAGQRMYAAYCRGIAEHLEQMGWIDRSVIYVTDEDKTDEIRQVALEIAEIVKQADPRLKSLVLSNASYRYPAYLDKIDFFGGPITPAHQQRFENQGGQWWGQYNSGGFPTTPLSYTRALGARSWLDGSRAYVNWAIWRTPDALVDLRQHWHLGANAGYAGGVFVDRSRTDFAMWGTWVYPWPAWEPWPNNARQNLFIGSLRLEALREAVEDYEYFEMARELAVRQRTDAQGDVPAELLLDQLRSLVDESHTRIHKFSYFDIDPEKYHQLRRQIGRMIREP